MEENNRKGPGVFYAVVGVATLVVAIIGATFAFFSAQATPGEGSETITGGTNNDLASALSISVVEVFKDGTVNPNVSHKLVPANITSGTNETALTSVKNAAANSCIANGYTGCHVWKITVRATQNIADANVYIDELTTNAPTKTDWHYTVYQGTSETAATSIALSGNFDVTTKTDMHTGGLTANQEVIYYLMVYLTNDENASQNDATSGGTNQTGTYNGTVSMDALGGKVSATFTAAGV